MKKIYLVRHGKTNANGNGVFQGHEDNHLNEEGHRQAKLLAGFFRNKRFGQIYTSDLIRTIETAEPVAANCGLPIIPVPAFKEICFGEWESLTYKEIKKRWPQELEDFFLTPDQTAIKDGESFAEVQTRSWQALQEIAAKQDSEDVLVVSHGGTIRALLCAILNLSLRELWRFEIYNAGVSCILHCDNKFWLQYVNENSFLSGDNLHE